MKFSCYDQDDVYYSTIVKGVKKRERVKKLVIAASCVAVLGAAFALENVEVAALKEVTIEVKHEIVTDVNKANIHSYIVPDGYELKFVDDEPVGYKYEMGTYTLGEYLSQAFTLKKNK